MKSVVTSTSTSARTSTSVRAALVAVALVLAIGLSSKRAHAQPSMTPAMQQPQQQDYELKNPATATTLALVGTAVPVALVIAGAAMDNDDTGGTLVGIGLLASTITPSMGHWYSGQYFTAGMAMRGLGGAAFLAGAMIEFNDCFLKECDGDNGTALIWLGGITYLSGMVYDIATAGSAAEDYNARHQAQRSFQVGPTVVGTRGTPGLGFVGTF